MPRTRKRTLNRRTGSELMKVATDVCINKGKSKRNEG